MKRWLIMLACIAALLAACGEQRNDRVAETAHGAALEAGHAHAHTPGGEKRTHYTERTELFVEFPRLVAGEASAFAAHLTRLPESQPLAAARVSVILSGGGEPEESFAIDQPSQAGIFRPVATPQRAGVRQLAIVVVTPGFSVRHELGSVTVYADRKSADAAPGQDDSGAIAFTKEQQWKVEFATAAVEERPMRASVPATGTLRARPDGEALLTAPAPGQVQPAGRFPRLGQAVRKGEVLAYLVPRLGGDTDLASLEADARKAKVALEHAARERTRLEALLKDEAVPEKRVHAARAAELSAQAEYDAAQGRLDQFGGRGGVPLRAPVSGRIADVRIAPGAYAQEGALLFHIADARVLWLELRVPESEAARLLEPSGATFRVEGIERGFEIEANKNARLIAVGGAVDPQTRTVPVLFEFAPADPRLRIGLAVRAQVFMAAARAAIAVPASAVIDEGGVSSAYVQTGGESFERRLVRTGLRDGDWVEITDGLAAGERLVTHGAYLVKLAASRPGEIGHGHAH